MVNIPGIKKYFVNGKGGRQTGLFFILIAVAVVVLAGVLFYFGVPAAQSSFSLSDLQFSVPIGFSEVHYSNFSVPYQMRAQLVREGLPLAPASNASIVLLPQGLVAVFNATFNPYVAEPVNNSYIIIMQFSTDNATYAENWIDNYTARYGSLAVYGSTIYHVIPANFNAGVLVTSINVQSETLPNSVFVFIGAAGNTIIVVDASATGSAYTTPFASTLNEFLDSLSFSNTAT